MMAEQGVGACVWSSDPARGVRGGGSSSSSSSTGVWNPVGDSGVDDLGE